MAVLYPNLCYNEVWYKETALINPFSGLDKQKFSA